ncbi:hypothetical protein CL654_00425 [bacterium]|nr:hypothetical protein [bacterium]|tara:strand:+ start:1311 stop:1823 length:513 start_codon:yes stop_codon:yes gene_type:complete
MANLFYKKGVTLIELLLYISIVGIIVGASIVLLITVQSSSTKNDSLVVVEEHGHNIIETITQAVRRADSVTGLVQGATSTTLTLVMSDSSINPTVFELASSTVQVTEGAGAITPLLPVEVQVTNLLFRNTTSTTSNAVIEIELSLLRVSSSTRNEFDYNEDFYGVASTRN